MHLLLPPSEAKTTGGRGRPLRPQLAAGSSGADRENADRKGDGDLEEARARVAGAVLDLCAGDPDRATAALALPAGVAAAAIATNAPLLDAPTTPALRRYAGVVYEGLDHASLSPAAQRVAARTVLVFSGLLGVVRGGDPVPPYRVPAAARLPGLGIAATFWRPVLDTVLPGLLRGGPVLDLRSTDYAAMWRPDAGLAARTIVVRVLSPSSRGGRAVISHPSKLGKGRLTRALVQRVAAGGRVDGVADVQAAWAACGGADSEQTAPNRLDLHTG